MSGDGYRDKISLDLQRSAQHFICTHETQLSPLHSRYMDKNQALSTNCNMRLQIPAKRCMFSSMGCTPYFKWLLLLQLLAAPAISRAQQGYLAPDEPIAEAPNAWNFNFSSPAPHFFASVYGLLSQWPNTFFPNGHSIVPCEIPPFTNLYHARTDANAPSSPEWFALDLHVNWLKKGSADSTSGMSYVVFGGTRNSHMFTYQTTRPVQCIYFDGLSGGLMGTQMLHLYGNVSGPLDGMNFLYAEYDRANGLCNWLREKRLGGLGWGYEASVRNNVGFEVIWCNFTSPSIRLVTHLNFSAPLLPAGRNDDFRIPDDQPRSMRIWRSKTSHHRCFLSHHRRRTRLQRFLTFQQARPTPGTENLFF